MEYARTWAGTLARRSWTVNRLIICWISKWSVTYFREKTPYIYIYIIERNCRLGRVLGVFNKCFGSLALGHLIELLARLASPCAHGKQLFVKSYDLSFQSVTVVISTYVCLYWIRGVLCGYAIRRPQTSHEISAWSYRVTAKYSYYIVSSYLLKIVNPPQWWKMTFV